MKKTLLSISLAVCLTTAPMFSFANPADFSTSPEPIYSSATAKQAAADIETGANKGTALHTGAGIGFMVAGLAGAAIPAAALWLTGIVIASIDEQDS